MNVPKNHKIFSHEKFFTILALLTFLTVFLTEEIKCGSKKILFWVRVLILLAFPTVDLSRRDIGLMISLWITVLNRREKVVSVKLILLQECEYIKVKVTFFAGVLTGYDLSTMNEEYWRRKKKKWLKGNIYWRYF